jgi:hypothetical protein
MRHVKNRIYLYRGVDVPCIHIGRVASDDGTARAGLLCANVYAIVESTFSKIILKSNPPDDCDLDDSQSSLAIRRPYRLKHRLKGGILSLTKLHQRY